MNKIIFAMALCGFGLIGCTKDLSDSEENEPLESSVIQQENAQKQSIEMTEEQAVDFASSLYKKIIEDEQFLTDAFELGEYETLSKYILIDLPDFVSKPYSDIEAKKAFGHVYYPDSYVMRPYVKCDTALGDLNVYASAMMGLIRDDTATTRKIYRQEKEDFMKSKAECSKLVSMSYEQAVAEDEK